MKFTAISLGPHHGCGIAENGTAVCWGSNFERRWGAWDGRAAAPQSETFTAIAAGNDFTCGLKRDGSPLCWGEGYDTPEPERLTYESIRDEKFVDVGAGWRNTCGLRSDGTTVCWGDTLEVNDYGRFWPPEDESFVSISVGGDYSCGLRVDGTTECWGWNVNNRSFPDRETQLVAVDVGGSSTCGLNWQGYAKCWGSVAKTSGGSWLPAPSATQTFATIDVGRFHVCALSSNGAAVCWGDNAYGGATAPGDKRFARISAGSNFTCALEQDGSPVCWGAKREGRDFGQANPPANEHFVAISSGHYHACGLRENGQAVCWGAQDGDESTGNYVFQAGYGQASPPSAERFTDLVSGAHHTCGLRHDGSLVCWGEGFPAPDPAGNPTTPAPALSSPLTLPTLPSLAAGVVPSDVPLRLQGEIRIQSLDAGANIAYWAERGFTWTAPEVEFDSSQYSADPHIGGLRSFARGGTDLAIVHVTIDDYEAGLAAEHGVDYAAIPLGTGAVGLYGHASLGIDCLSIDKLRDIWSSSGQAQTWQDVDPNLPREAINRIGNKSPIIIRAFEELVLHEGETLPAPDPLYYFTTPVIDQVSEDMYAIGFGDYSARPERSSSTRNTKLLSIDFGDGCIQPNHQSLIDGSYTPTFGPLYLYVNRESLTRKELRLFISYFAENARAIVGRAGYLPYSQDRYLELFAPLFE